MRRPNARSQPVDQSDPTMDSFKPNPRSNPVSTSRNPARLISIAIASAVALLLYWLAILRTSSSSSTRFGIIIDGGSTGTRIHVFVYEIGKGFMPEIDFKRTVAMKVSPGLSAYSDNPEAVGESLVELMEFGRKRVPKDQWWETEVRLMATAGLRLLDVGVQERILEACRRVLRASEFRFQDDWAIVIPGSDEGIYAWVAANYAMGTLGGDAQETMGIIELGGASAQVAYASNEPLPPEFASVLEFGETSYNLYSNSFLHLGQNVAYDSLYESLRSREVKSTPASVYEGMFRDPCTPKGYLHGVEVVKSSSDLPHSKTKYNLVAHTVGNFTECRSAALMLLQEGKVADKCSHQHCKMGSTIMPKLQGRFLATENFFYTSKFFGLGPSSFLSDLMLAGEQFCGEDWLKLKSKHHTLEEEDLLRYCFSSAYIVALLHDVLGIPLDDKRVAFANQVGDVPLDWALGAFVLQRTSDLSMAKANWITNIINSDTTALCFLLIVSSVLLFVAWSVSRWRKPLVKTIYDLERGRYITKRIKQ